MDDKKKGLPAWGKVVIICVAIVCAAFIAFMGLGVWAMANGYGSSQGSSESANSQQEENDAVKEDRDDVDKSLLKSSLDEYNALDPEQYTTESYSAMDEALKNGQAVFEKQDATQDEVTQAVAVLGAASTNLKEVFNPENYTAVAYADLARTPDAYAGQRIVISGKVLQVSESATEIDLRVATDGGYEDVVMVGYDPDLLPSRILKDDMINAYGISIGLYKYTSTMGASISVPGLFADQVELQQ